MYNRKDHYYKKAKDEGRASRAVYKLEQIQSKFKIIRKGDKVLDLGCAPGGWMEIVSEIVGKDGLVVGIDLLPLKIQLRPNMKYVQGDINDDEALNKVAAELALPKNSENQKSKLCGYHHCVDVVISDMAPNTSGVAFKDCFLSYELCTMALDTAKKMLKPNGNFAAKIFQGKEVEEFKRDLRACFQKVAQYLPPATREGSKEIYIVATGFKG